MVLEGHIQAMALWYRILGGLAAAGLAGVRFLLVGYGFQTVMLWTTILVVVSIVGLGFAGSLASYQPWARSAAFIFAVIGALGQLSLFLLNPLGGAIGLLFTGYQAVVLNQATRLTTPDYRAAAASGQKASPFGSIFFWVPFVAIGILAVEYLPRALR